MRRLLSAAARRLRHTVSVIARGVGRQVAATVAQAWRDLTIIVTVLLMAALAAEVALRVGRGDSLIARLFGG